MLTGGKLADVLGRRLIFVVGIVVFTLASLACGLADSGDVLIAARIVQGVGAALMNPATLSIISATFPPQQRGTAIGIWAGVSALALAIGPLVGGLLTEHVDWSWIFFVNVPVGILAIAASFLFIDESRDETRTSSGSTCPGLLTSGARPLRAHVRPDRGEHVRLDAPAGSSARSSSRRSRSSPSSCSSGTSGCRCSTSTLFRSGTFAGANLVILLVALAMFGVFFFVSLYMQNILGYSAVQAGAAFLPMTILIILIAPIAGKASDRDRLALADDGRDGARRRPARLLLAARRRTRRSGRSCPAMLARRRRDGADDDAERRGRDPQRAGGQVRRRLGGAERVPPGRRLDRDRADGRDHGRTRRAGAARPRRSWTASRPRSVVAAVIALRRRGRRRRARPPARARGAARPTRSPELAA